MKDQNYNFSKFITLNNLPMDIEEVIKEIVKYTQKESDKDYRIIIGTDSEGYDLVAYASAIVVHRVGFGGRAFICKNILKTPKVLREKIMNEATISLALAQEILPPLTKHLGEEFLQKNFMIHVDVGTKGETKEMIKTVTGMVRGFGFQVSIKPESFAASSVADRYASPPKKVDL